ncbi:retrovirus-related pol polyprotein from transposon TNT 1-94 [Tanacetum coccineum]
MTLKKSSCYQNPFHLKRAQRIQPRLYDGSVIAKEHVVISVTDDEETLLLEEESRSKMLDKQNDPISIEKKIKISPIDYSKLNKIKEDFEILSQEIVHIAVNYVHSFDVKKSCVNECNKCLELETGLLKKKDLIEKDVYDKLLKSYSTIEKHCISLELTTQLNQEVFQKDNFCENQNAPTFNQLFELNELKAQSQEKDTVIRKLKDMIKSLSGKDSLENVKKDIDEIETINIKLEHRMFKLNIEPIYHRLKNNRDAHEVYIEKTIEYTGTLHVFVERARTQNPSKPLLESACRTFTIVGNKCPLTRIASTKVVSTKETSTKLVATPTQGILIYSRRPKATRSVGSSSKVVQIVLWYLDSGCSKHMTRNRSQLINFVSKFLGTVRFGNDHIAKIMGYEDYQMGNVTIFQVYYVEGLGHNLFSVGQFCDSDLEVAFRKHTCFIRDLDGVDLLKGSRGSNLYTLSMDNLLLSSLICLLSKASKTKSWLCHRRLSHLNFDYITSLAKQGLVRGLLKLKYQKDHLCSTCALGESKKHSHKPKAEDSIQEKLYLLHMDLCRPMRV